jgi:hypothetical protein
MRSSIGGWLENSAIMPPGLPAMPIACTDLGSSPGLQTAQARQRVDHRLLAAHQLRRAGVGTELALAREPGHDDGGEQPSTMSSTMVVTK